MGLVWSVLAAESAVTAWHEHARFLAAAVECPSPYRLNLSEKAFHGTVIPSQTFGSDTNYTFLRGIGKKTQDVPVPGRLSATLLGWKALQEKFKGRRIMAPGGIAFAASQFVFAGYSGAPFSNRAFNLRLRAACRALGVGEITAHGLRHSAVTILLNQVGKDLREIQELLRHKNIRTTVRYTHVGYEQTRQTAEALSDTLE